MNNDLKIMIFIATFVWAFVVYRLIAAKKIKIPFKYGNKLIIYLLFAIPTIFLIIKKRDIYSFAFGLIIILASALFASIPSGFCEDGIILYGKLYKFTKMNSMDIEKNPSDCRLTFEYRKIAHVIIGSVDDEMSYKQILAYYQTLNGIKHKHE